MKPSELAEEYVQMFSDKEMRVQPFTSARKCYEAGFERAIELCLEEVAMFSWDKPHNGFSEYGKGAQEVVDQIINNIKSLSEREIGRASCRERV